MAPVTAGTSTITAGGPPAVPSGSMPGPLPATNGGPVGNSTSTGGATQFMPAQQGTEGLGKQVTPPSYALGGEKATATDPMGGVGGAVSKFPMDQTGLGGASDAVKGVQQAPPGDLTAILEQLKAVVAMLSDLIAQMGGKGTPDTGLGGSNGSSKEVAKDPSIPAPPTGLGGATGKEPFKQVSPDQTGLGGATGQFPPDQTGLGGATDFNPAQQFSVEQTGLGGASVKEPFKQVSPDQTGLGGAYTPTAEQFSVEQTGLGGAYTNPAQQFSVEQTGLGGAYTNPAQQFSVEQTGLGGAYTPPPPPPNPEPTKEPVKGPSVPPPLSGTTEPEKFTPVQQTPVEQTGGGGASDNSTVKLDNVDSKFSAKLTSSLGTSVELWGDPHVIIKTADNPVPEKFDIGYGPGQVHLSDGTQVRWTTFDKGQDRQFILKTFSVDGADNSKDVNVSTDDKKDVTGQDVQLTDSQLKEFASALRTMTGPMSEPLKNPVATVTADGKVKSSKAA